MDSMCGLSVWRPKWLQRFATVKSFLIIFGLLGTIQAMGFHYFTVTLTTVEKRFKTPSYATGIALSGNEISEVLFSLILSYFGGKRNRPKWIAWGGLISACSCFILAFAHFLYGPGEDAVKLTAEYVNSHNINASALFNLTAKPNAQSPNKLCLEALELDNHDQEYTLAPLILIFISQFIFGIGTTLYYTLGSSYLDDVSQKKDTPMMMAYALAFRIFGLIISFGLVAAMMRLYIDPWSTPLIDHTDPRWLGAWWLGWYILGAAVTIFSLFVGLYPAVLPKAKCRTLQETQTKNNQYAIEEEQPMQTHPKGKVTNDEEKDSFCLALKRMLTNKLLMCNTFGTIFYVLGATVSMTYYSKYLEVQFNKNSADSDATLVSGPVTILSMVSGILCSGYVISKYQPPAQKLLLFKVFVGFMYVAGQFSNMFLSCETGSFVNETGLMNLTTSCNENCSCAGVPYSPVCDEARGLTYFSPCHAGCKSGNDTAKRYLNCECAFTEVDTTNYKTYMLKPDTDRTVGSLNNLKNPNIPILSSTNIDYKNRTIDALNTVTLSMIPGACVAGCGIIFMVYTLISCLISSLGAAARIVSLLINFRSIPVRDKSFALGVSIFMLSLFGLIPGPIIFGYIIDSTCLIWNDNGGKQGNCQIYDQTRFRYYLNCSAIAITLISTGFEALVWWHGRHLELYREDDDVKVEEHTEDTSLISRKRLK